MPFTLLITHPEKVITGAARYELVQVGGIEPPTMDRSTD